MRQVFLTVDLGFGDAGKGSVVDFLTREHAAHTVVRYNGGAQAGHRVVDARDPRRAHVFAQFGSGTLAGAATHLSRSMLLDPLAMLQEEQHLRSIGVADAFARTTIDGRAPLLTPFARAANRLKELARGAARHGSCGMGIGETMADLLEFGPRVVRAADLADPDTLARKLSFVRDRNREKVDGLRALVPASDAADAEWDWLDASDSVDWLIEAYREFTPAAQIVGDDFVGALLRRPGTVVFEGAQGVLLDECYGFHPHTTWSTTTLRNADRLLEEAGYDGVVQRLGITRAYSTRHGAGPLVTEDAALTAALPDAANTFGPWQQAFRCGWLDLVLLRYAHAAVGRLDGLAVTCLDRAAELPALQVCDAYDAPTGVLRDLPLATVAASLEGGERIGRLLAQCRPLLEPVADEDALLERLAQALQVPVALVSHGPDAAAKQLIGSAARR